jgi:hypothetical protein
VAILAFRRDPMTTVWIYVDTKKDVGEPTTTGSKKT